ncbi:RNA polymerase sigma factor [Agromyces mediolanus]|uniref:RNA polymerase subunit sigma-24 n=1 Tax=Agromyces mediolanus TaxID=41986 RepID=A0A918CKA9_AGRME|nr:DUF6596 domain-containing protein [Agromyces mediolanus]GGR27545.1 RNA polymerase subunit sigma-24 [Agromyces mediolanus]GLJ71941.1 RNA polymerase subunit sigma-24 [Agromyces mediolanus]
MTTGADASPAHGGGASDLVLARIVRADAARITTALARSFGDLDLAEECVAGAIEHALREWRVRGVPDNPAGWIMTTARHDALDRVRRDARFRTKVALLADPTLAPVAGPADERLPLLFGCCHPALAPEAQLALALRAVLGLTTRQIARASGEPMPTVAQRISRAKRKISTSGIPLQVPPATELPARLDLVLAMVAVMYDAAHLRQDTDAAADRDLAEDAVWLAEVATGELPDQAEAHGLLALLRFHRAREPARARDGDLVTLDRQDRARWNGELIAEARASLDAAARLRRPGRWQLQAAIAACHADAASTAATDWPQILVLYDVLLAYDPSPVVRLNRAVTLGEVAGPRAALAELDRLESDLVASHRWHAVRGAFLRRDGQPAAAAAAEQRAAELTDNLAERRLLRARSAGSITPSDEG